MKKPAFKPAGKAKAPVQPKSFTIEPNKGDRPVSIKDFVLPKAQTRRGNEFELYVVAAMASTRCSVASTLLARPRESTLLARAAAVS